MQDWPPQEGASIPYCKTHSNNNLLHDPMRMGFETGGLSRPGSRISAAAVAGSGLRPRALGGLETA